jgi:TonB family protein
MKTARLLLCLIALAIFTTARAAQATNDDSLQKLRLDKFVMPEFPESLLSTGNGKGVVTAAIGRDGEGRVTDVLVLDSTHARLTQSVTEAVRQWKFKLPANPAPAGREIVPIVRFLFSMRGVLFISAYTGTLQSPASAITANSPVVLPTFADLDAVPEPLHHPMPRFTGRLAEPANGGTVTVKFFLDETGKVRVPIILECSTPELGSAALAAVEQWTFTPPRAAGRETIALETQTFAFGPPKS